MRFVHAKARNVPEHHAGEFGYGDVWIWMVWTCDEIAALLD